MDKKKMATAKMILLVLATDELVVEKFRCWFKANRPSLLPVIDLIRQVVYGNEDEAERAICILKAHHTDLAVQALELRAKIRVSTEEDV